jgi:hypothetical protein
VLGFFDLLRLLNLLYLFNLLHLNNLRRSRLSFNLLIFDLSLRIWLNCFFNNLLFNLFHLLVGLRFRRSNFFFLSSFVLFFFRLSWGSRLLCLSLLFCSLALLALHNFGGSTDCCLLWRWFCPLWPLRRCSLLLFLFILWLSSWLLRSHSCRFLISSLFSRVLTWLII